MRAFARLARYHQAREAGLRGDVRVAGMVGSDALCEHSYGASAVKTEGGKKHFFYINLCGL